MIILLNPKSADYSFRPPVALLYLGSLLEGNYDYEIVDQNMDKDVLNTLIQKIKETGAKHIGITVMPGPQMIHAIPVSKELKRIYPHLNIIWGGYFPTFHPNTVLSADYVDFAFRGNVESSFLDFIDILEGKNGAKQLKDIAGLCYKENGKIIHNPIAETTDPDTIPVLPYYKMDIDKYLRPGKTHLGPRTMNYLSSIGCPFTCGFCAIAGLHKGTWLGKDPELVYRDIKYLRENYNIGALEFHDDNFFVAEKRAYAIAEHLKEFNLRWWGEARPDTVMKYSDETLQMLADSGLKMVYFGAESSSEEMLKLMNKGGTQTPQTVLDLAARFKKFGIVPEFSFILGAPSEHVDEDIDRDIKFIRKIKTINPLAEIILYIYSPVNFEDSEMSLASKMKGFDYPKTLDEWLSPRWKNFDIRKYAQTPWLKKHHIKKIKNFERALNARYPTLTDTKMRGWKRTLLEVMGSWRYGLSIYAAPYEIRLAQKLLKYRQPETEGFAFEG